MEEKLCQVSEEASESSGDILWMFCIGRGKDPPCHMMWYVFCYTEDHEDYFFKSEKKSVGY